MVASKQVDTLKADADKVRQEIDETVLLETKTLFQLYAVMWGKASEAEAVVSGHEDGLFTTFGQQVHDYAVSVHEWINEELQSLCEYHEGCMKVRAAVIKLVEANVNHCDERFTEYYCKNHHAGIAPSGRTCKWIPPQPEKGIRGDCKTLKLPTVGLKFHQETKTEEGAGIFY